ncbi:MAG TPA: peptide deformylase [Peptococcaceae bacterium]|nr:MAG: Peptide deformylase [Clostridia bacterium 41_269]HBT20057.1 peptide deformylase [Peptococcaceae bacterium]
MAVYSIVKIGDPVLRERAQEVKEVNDTIKKLLKNMADTMYDAKGVGLAAPQIGVSKRVIVVDVGEGLVELVNPEIIELSDETEIDIEGCLSIPGVQGEVERAKRIRVKGLDGDGNNVIINAEDFFARALQHEIDHLDGVLFVDKVKRFVD